MKKKFPCLHTTAVDGTSSCVHGVAQERVNLMRNCFLKCFDQSLYYLKQRSYCMWSVFCSLSGGHLKVITFSEKYVRTICNSVERSPSSEANSSSPSQVIPRILQNIRMSPPIVPALSQISPVLAHPNRIININFNIILPSTPRSSKCSFSSGFFTKPCIHLASNPFALHAPSVSFFLVCQN